MATITTEQSTEPRAGAGHYRAYRPRPFTRAERDSVTILFGGLHWRVERVLQASGFDQITIRPDTLRREAGKPVLGWVVRARCISTTAGG